MKIFVCQKVKVPVPEVISRFLEVIYLVVPGGYLVVPAGYLIVPGGYLIVPGGYLKMGLLLNCSGPLKML